MKTERKQRKLPLAALLPIGVLAAVSFFGELAPCLASEHSSQLGRRRHVIIGIDVSTSMKSGAMSSSRMNEVKDFLLEILYKRLPAGVKPPHSLDEKLFNKKVLRWDQPLYAEGDTLTCFSFAESVAYHGLRKRKQFVSRSDLSKYLPSYPQSFSGRSTFLETAYVGAYDNYESRVDGETFLVLVSDMERDRKGGSHQSEYIFQKYHLYQQNYPMVPCYALYVAKRIWITVYKIAPAMEPESSGELCLSDPIGDCRLSEQVVLSQEGSVLRSPPLRIMAAQGRSTGSCKLKKVELFIRSKERPGAVTIEDTRSDGARLPAKVRLSLNPQLAKDLPRCEPLNSVLQVLCEDAGADRPTFKEIPLVLKIMPPEVSSTEVFLTTQPKHSGSNLSFQWSSGVLRLPKHYLVAKDDNLLATAEIKKVVVKAGSAGHWEFNDVIMTDLSAPLDFQVSEQQARRLLEESPNAASVEILYASGCFETDSVLSISVPVTIPEVDCPENAFSIVRDASSHEPAKLIEMPRDRNNLLKTPPLILEQNAARQPLRLVGTVQSVQLRIKGVTKTWGPVGHQTLPRPLDPQAFSPAESASLAPGKHQGELTVTYGCVRGAETEVSVVQPVSVIVPPLVRPRFTLTDKNRQPLTTLKVTSFFGHARVDGLFLNEQSNILLPSLGVTIKEIQVAGAKDATVWQSWKSVTDLPFSLAFRASGLRFLPEDAAGTVPVQVKVTYNITGSSSPDTFAERISLAVTDVWWTVLPPIFVVLAMIVGTSTWRLFRDRNVQFYLRIFRQEGESDTTDWYSLKKGQKLHLYPDKLPNCPGLNCQECWIENRKGELFIVRRGDPGERVFEGLKYDLTRDREDISIEVSQKARKDASSSPSQGPEPPMAPDKSDW